MAANFAELISDQAGKDRVLSPTTHFGRGVNCAMGARRRRRPRPVQCEGREEWRREGNNRGKRRRRSDLYFMVSPFPSFAVTPLPCRLPPLPSVGSHLRCFPPSPSSPPPTPFSDLRSPLHNNAASRESFGPSFPSPACRSSPLEIGMERMRTGGQTTEAWRGRERPAGWRAGLGPRRHRATPKMEGGE